MLRIFRVSRVQASHGRTREEKQHLMQLAKLFPGSPHQGSEGRRPHTIAVELFTSRFPWQSLHAETRF